MLQCFNWRGEKEKARLLFKEESFINGLLKVGDRLLFDNKKQNVKQIKDIGKRISDAVGLDNFIL